MNILFVAHERNLGGASRSLVTLAEELQEHGNKITVVIPMKCGQVYRELKKKNIPVFRIFFGWWMMPSYWNPVMKMLFRILYAFEWIPVRRIALLAKKHDIQIIHSNSSAIDVGAKAALRAGIPHVWHIREFGDLDYRLEFLKGRSESSSFMTKVPGKLVFISENLRRYYDKEIPDDSCRVIYNGISQQFLIPKGSLPQMGHRKLVFLISGNLHRGKRQDLALKACEILMEEGYDNFRLVIAGAPSGMADSREYEKELRSMASHKMKDLVEFTGYVSDMVSLRKRADAELVCSSREAFGRVTVEAMMASNPVIASDAGANPELIVSGENGLLFEEGNARALAQCMQELLEQPELVRRMGDNAFRYASGKFLSEMNTQQIEALYGELAGDGTLRVCRR